MTKSSIPTTEESLKKLRSFVEIFNDEKITTEKHDLWSVKKLIVLRYYIYPFLTILRKNGYKKLHYVDLFAGSGLLNIRGKIMPGTSLIPLLTTIDMITRHDTHFFDEIHLSDNNKKYVQLLNDRVSRLSVPTKSKIIINKSEFINSVKQIFPGVPPKFEERQENAYLVVLDPFGFQVDWENLEWILKSGAVDVIITFHTRLASWNQNKEQSAVALTRMFGNNDWLSCNDEDDFMKLYCEKIQQVHTTWKPFQTKTLTVGRGSGKYHLICASRAPSAGNVFDDIQQKFDAVDHKLLTKIFDTSVGDQSKLDSFVSKT